MAKQLRELDPKKYTQKVIARMLGVAQQTVSDRLRHNTCAGKAPQRADARVVVPKSERSKIAAMARKAVPTKR